MLKLQESTFLDTLSRLALFSAPEETSIPPIWELPPVTQRYIPVTQRYIPVTLRYIHVTQRYIHVTAGDWLLGEDLGVVHVESDAGPSDKVDVRNEIRRLGARRTFIFLFSDMPSGATFGCSDAPTGALLVPNRKYIICTENTYFGTENT